MSALSKLYAALRCVYVYTVYVYLYTAAISMLDANDVIARHAFAKEELISR